jgi:hypothetical protein
MAIKRIVSTDFWTDNKVVDCFTPEDKYFMLYLLTNPHTTQLGIYKLNTKIAAFELGYSQEAVVALLERFENKHQLLKYSKETQEVAIKNYLRHSIVKGGKPVLDCLNRELGQVKNVELVEYVLEEIKGASNLNVTVLDFVNQHTIKNDNENDNENENDNDNENDDSCLVSERIVQPSYAQIKDQVLASKKTDEVGTCEWCGKETQVLQKHHYPIPKRDGGTNVVNICYECHHAFHKTEYAMNKKTIRHKYGSYKNVLLSDEELETLQAEYDDWFERIERLSEYIASSGKKYKNFLATIRSWARKEKGNTPKSKKGLTEIAKELDAFWEGD